MSLCFPPIARALPLMRFILAGVMFTCLFAANTVAQDRALIISIDSYADAGLGGLPSGLAKNNSATIKKLLTEKLRYKPEHIKVLQNKQATKSAILKQIASWLGPKGRQAVATPQIKGLDESGALKKKSKGKKRVKKRRKKRAKNYRSYLYFAGFGLLKPDEGEGKLGQTLLPYDASIVSGGDKKNLSGVITGADLEDAIAKFVRRHTTIVFDTKNLENKSYVHARAIPAPPMPTLRPLTGSVGGGKKKAAGLKKKSQLKSNPKLIFDKVTLWSAASPGQSALVAGSKEKPVGLFTSNYVKAIADAQADANANSIITNAEVLHFVSDLSSAHCHAHKEHCAAGVKPLLRPAKAYGRTVWVDRAKVTRGKERRLTLTRLTDFLGVKAPGDVSIKQNPPSPLKVGAGNIHYEVISASAGHLILLNLTDKGELFQLYPNQYAGQDDKGFAGKLAANTPLKVPEKSYGVSFSATVPAKGHIIAVLAPGPVKFDASVNARSISSVSPREAIRVYLAELSAALSMSSGLDNQAPSPGKDRWSVVTLPYEILP